MRHSAAFLLPLFIAAATAEPTGMESTTARAEEHVRKACEVVWMNAAAYQVQRCTERAMAALGEDDRLRDNELKRMLIESEKDLESCQAELDGLRDDLARHETSAARRNPRLPVPQ